MHVRRLGPTIEVTTPAKINLFLEVLGRRPDGYHEIETVLAAVSLYDTLRFTPQDDAGLALTCRWATSPPGDEIPTGPENLAWRAAELVRQRAGIAAGASIELVKRIPAAAGLGGASSDAAAALLAANLAWRLDWPRELLLELAAELGSDVPFFLLGGAALARGRGERLQPLSARRLHIVLVRPPVGLTTGSVYRACRPAEQPVGSGRLVAALAAGDAAAVGRALTNGLAPAAEGLTPWIQKLQHELQQQGVLGHEMSGSGSSCFGVCRHARQARRVARRLRARGLGQTAACTTTGR